jgi:regulatory protein
MPQITDIKLQRNKKRFNIYLDEKFAFGIDAETLAKADLKINQIISEEKVQELVKEDDFLKAYERVLKFFSYRPRSEKELHDWFKRKEVGEETQKLILKKLESLGFINDKEFAKWWIEQRKTFHPGGQRLLKLELFKKGISREIVDSILTEEGPVDELSVAKKVVEKKLKVWRGLPKEALRRKLTGVLARRGFSWDIIKEILKDETDR